MDQVAQPRVRNTTVLVPLAHEHAALRRALDGRAVRIVQCGPGSEGIVRWAESQAAMNPATPPGLVILAGVAGSLRTSLPAGEVILARTVLGPDRQRYDSTLVEELIQRGHALPMRAGIVSGTQPVTGVSEKAALAERSGADCVDMESARFAEAATLLGWRWLVLRAISDGAGMKLPAEIGDWVDESGRTRHGRVLKSLLRRPWILPSLVRLSTSTKLALTNLGRELGSLLEQIEAMDDVAAAAVGANGDG